jgi:hypothetical protein
LFSTKLSSNRKELEQQKKTKMKKKRKKVVGKPQWSFSWGQKKLHGFVLCNKGVWVRNFVEKTCQTCFGTRKSLMLIEGWWEKNVGFQKKPIKLLLVLREAWQIFFLQSQAHMEKN